MGIGEIITQADLQSLQRFVAQSAAVDGFVAPTFFRLANQTFKGWNVYSSRAAAMQQFLYLNNVPGAKQQQPAETLKFSGTQAQTAGINIDFFYYIPAAGWITAPYAWVRRMIHKVPVFTAPVRFYPTDGSGKAKYAIFDSRFFGISATAVGRVGADKIAALDSLHREIQTAKARYNELSHFVTELSKRQLTQAQQPVYNRALLLLQNMDRDLRSVKGIEITYSNGTVSAPWLLIAAIVVLAGVAGWTITSIAREREKTKRINESYDIQKFIAEQNAAIEANPNLTAAQKQKLIADNNKITAGAIDNAKEASKEDKGPLDKITNLLLIGGGTLVVLSLLKQRNNG